MSVDIGPLAAFSNALLSLNELAQSTPPQRLIQDALGALRPLVPFRSAWWGECSGREAQDRPRNWLHGRINLGESFAEEWNHLAERDRFANDSMRHAGRVQRFSGDDDPDPLVQAFARRHALDHGMAVTVELPGSGLLFFVALYRSAASPPFSDTESALFAAFCAHLLQHWRQRVRALLMGAQPRASDDFALADTDGRLLYLGARLGRLLHQHHPDWSGSTLPAELASMAARAPIAVSLGAYRLALHPCGEVVTLALERGGRVARLPPRERSVAMLYAQGKSYKEIARLLGLSPATVRTYLRSVYLQLGVRNKIELGSALDPASRTRR